MVIYFRPHPLTLANLVRCSRHLNAMAIPHLYYCLTLYYDLFKQYTALRSLIGTLLARPQLASHVRQLSLTDGFFGGHLRLHVQD